MLNKITLPLKANLGVKSSLSDKIPKRTGLPVLNKEGNISPTELLQYQTKVYAYHLKIEIISKAASAVTGTLQRLQS